MEAIISNSAIVFAREQYDAIAFNPEIMSRHWKELGHEPDSPLAPDFKAFAMLEEADVLRVYTARVDDMLVGYSLFVISKDLLIAERKIAMQYLLWLDFEYRRGFTGYNLLKKSAEGLRDEGVASISFLVNHRFPALSILLGRMNARKTEEIWKLNLGGL